MLARKGRAGRKRRKHSQSTGKERSRTPWPGAGAGLPWGLAEPLVRHGVMYAQEGGRPAGPGRRVPGWADPGPAARRAGLTGRWPAIRQMRSIRLNPGNPPPPQSPPGKPVPADAGPAGNGISTNRREGNVRSESSAWTLARTHMSTRLIPAGNLVAAPVPRMAASQGALWPPAWPAERKEDVLIPDWSFTLPSFTSLLRSSARARFCVPSQIPL